MALTPGQQGLLRTQLRGELTRTIAGRASGGIGVAFSTALSNGLLEASQQIPRYAEALGTALKADLLQGRRLEVNRQIAEGAANAVAEAYGSRNPIRNHRDYRRNAGRLPGVLGPLLANIGDMTAHTTRDRISFVNTDSLDAEAFHWRRLNFGAGENHGKNPKAYAVELIGPQGGVSTVAVLQLPDLATGPIVMPRGYWIGEFPGGEFHLGTAPKGSGHVGVSGTHDSRATQFLDAGVKYVSQHAGNAYVRMFNEAIQNPRTIAAVESRFGRKIEGLGVVSFEGRRVASVL